jgi:hypothetical protein
VRKEFKMNLIIDTNLDEQLDKVREIIHYLREIEAISDLLRFITIKEFAEITGWSVPTVQNLYNRPDFPSTDYSKKKAEIHATVEYFKVPRRK